MREMRFWRVAGAVGLGATLFAAAGGLAASAVAQAAQDGTRVRAYSVSEQRSVRVGRPIEGVPDFTDAGMTLRVLVEGPAAEGARAWGKLELETAADDRGRPLKAKEVGGFFGNDPWEEIDLEQMWFFADEPPARTLLLDLPFELCARDASSIARLEGSLTLVRGESETLFVDDPAGAAGSAVLRERLGGTGATVTLESFSADPGQHASVVVKDPRGAVVGVDLVDASGESVTDGSSSFGFGDETTYGLMGSGRLGRGVRLAVTVSTSREEVEVLFALRGIELP